MCLNIFKFPIDYLASDALCIFIITFNFKNLRWNSSEFILYLLQAINASWYLYPPLMIDHQLRCHTRLVLINDPNIPLVAFFALNIDNFVDIKGESLELRCHKIIDFLANKNIFGKDYKISVDRIFL